MAVGRLDGVVTVFAADAAGVRAWDLRSGEASGPPWDGQNIGGVSSLAAADLAGREILLTSSDDGHIHVWDRADGRALGEPLPGVDPPVHALSAVGSGPLLGRLRVSIAVGKRLRIAVLSPAGDSVVWSDELALNIGSRALSLAWVDHRTLAVGCEMGIVTLQLRDTPTDTPSA
jgi:hypothetical protein